MSNFKIVTPRGWVSLFVLGWKDKKWHFAFWYPVPSAWRL